MNPLSHLQADWPAINRLLDEALELPPAERSAWLAALPADVSALKDTVARLLAATGGVETGDFLHTLPKLGAAGLGAAASGAQAGAEVGPWRLLREIGEGGMGSVWLAERADGSLKRQVALKLPRLSWQRGLAERMARERDILATLEHPNIARLYDAGVDALGRPWLALEYVQGQPIDAHARHKALDLKQRLQLLLQVCEAVAYAHSRLVIHRDLKPGNILVTDDGQVKLLDFGIAKLMQGEQAGATALTELSGRAFTLDYASPEQVRGEPLTTASDVYSLGVVAYELLAGARPYRLDRGSAAELEEAIIQAEAPLASRAAARDTARSLRGDLDAILAQALRKDAERRYSTVAALALDLGRHLRGEAVLARPDARADRLRKWLWRYRSAWAVAGAVALALLGGAYAQAAVVVALAAGLLAALWQRREAMRQAGLARHEAAVGLVQRQRAEKVKAFAVGLFENADLMQGAKADTTALQLLERAEAELSQVATGDAATDVELRLVLARSLAGFDAPARALAVIEPALQQAARNLPGDHPLALEGELVALQALTETGRHADVEARMTSLWPRLGSVPSMAARARLIEASTHYKQGRYAPSLDSVRMAVSLAEEAADDGLLLRALNEQTRLLAHLFLGERLASARRALDAAGRCDARRHAVDILLARETAASAECFEGDARQGLAAFGAIVHDLEQRLGPGHTRVAAAHNARAGAQYQCGDSEGALASLQRCMAIEQALNGPDTQHMRMGLAGMGGILVNEGRYEEGLTLLRRARQGMLQHEGPQHALARVAASRLVAGLLKAGELEEAEQVLNEREQASFANDAERDEWAALRAGLLRCLGRHDEALATLVPMQERRIQSPMLHTRALAASELGAVLLDAGRHEEALPPLQMAIDLFSMRHPGGSAALARLHTARGRALLARGESAAAVAAMRAALDYWEAHAPDVEPASEARAWLALALQAAGDRAQAQALAQRVSLRPLRRKVHRLAVLDDTLQAAGLSVQTAA